RFTISGQGFLWRQTNSSMVISNQVHTWVYQGLLGPGGEGVRTNVPAPQAKPMEITSDRFEYETNSGLGIYNGNVHVVGTNVDMTEGQLALKIPLGQDLASPLPGGNQLESI